MFSRSRRESQGLATPRDQLFMSPWADNDVQYPEIGYKALRYARFPRSRGLGRGCDWDDLGRAWQLRFWSHVRVEILMQFQNGQFGFLSDLSKPPPSPCDKRLLNPAPPSTFLTDHNQSGSSHYRPQHATPFSLRPKLAQRAAC